SIGLKFRGRLQNGVVYDPLREEMFTCAQGEGAFLNDRRMRVTPRRGLEGALLGTGIPFRDLTHMDAYIAMLRDLIPDSAGIRRPGSAALDFAYVASGRLDGFWELGLSQWDLAAGTLLVREAGGSVTDIGGGDRHLETGNVVAAGIHLHAAMLKVIRPHLSDRLAA
ncbi:MAG: inositol monophosphatase family protein, partial [Pseudomonadota bacterium]